MQLSILFMTAALTASLFQPGLCHSLRAKLILAYYRSMANDISLQSAIHVSSAQRVEANREHKVSPAST
jgi:hypothetical protein